MKRQRICRTWLPVLGAGLALGVSTAAHAAFINGLVNVDFNYKRLANSSVSATASGAAVIGTTGDTWNGIEGASFHLTATSLPLVNSANTATDATLSYTVKGGYSVGAGQSNPVNTALLNDWVSVTGTNHGTITIGGLGIGTSYDLYIYYSQSDQAARATALTVTGNGTPLTGTIQNNSAGGATAYTSGVNYLKFTLSPDASGNIAIDFVKAGTDPQHEGDINGFQIQAVPEPASLSLLSLGGLALLRRRRS